MTERGHRDTRKGQCGLCMLPRPGSCYLAAQGPRPGLPTGPRLANGPGTLAQS